MAQQCNDRCRNVGETISTLAESVCTIWICDDKGHRVQRVGRPRLHLRGTLDLLEHVVSIAMVRGHDDQTVMSGRGGEDAGEGEIDGLDGNAHRAQHAGMSSHALPSQRHHSGYVSAGRARPCLSSPDSVP